MEYAVHGPSMSDRSRGSLQCFLSIRGTAVSDSIGRNGPFIACTRPVHKIRAWVCHTTLRAGSTNCLPSIFGTFKVLPLVLPARPSRNLIPRPGIERMLCDRYPRCCTTQPNGTSEYDHRASIQASGVRNLHATSIGLLLPRPSYSHQSIFAGYCKVTISNAH
ncbi:hypothetical protein BDV96DRAFT_256090 [Lophiotrema nucula]|uniref:Uncharacterized protein n=1 Tax=Lophiotrema nucula TaxID=690887 RepID=A0A6A5YRD5_9PLEO|nr:hypothetical protein BDV96DRAFT_256090 [Lophiotrema nucula]